MVAISQAGRLNPLSQLGQCFLGIGSLISNIFERSDAAFRRVTLERKDEQGNVTILKHKYIEEIATGDLYWDEPDFVIASKCVLVAFGLPVFTVGWSIWNITVMPLEIASVAFNALDKAVSQLKESRFSQCVVTVWHGCSHAFGVLINRIFEVVKSPLFLLGAELAAIYGLFRPYQGRKFEAQIEKAWQQGLSYKDDFRHTPAGEKGGVWNSYAQEIKTHHPYYAAHCFQVRGNIHHPEFTVIRSEPVPPNSWIYNALNESIIPAPRSALHK